MASNLEKHRADIKTLIDQGKNLEVAFAYFVNPQSFDEVFPKKEDLDRALAKLPNFRRDYQSWYSEAQAVIKQLLPHRLADFVKLYEVPKSRKNVDVDTYRIEDALLGLYVSKGGKNIVESSTAIGLFQQQVNILRAAERRFESALFDLKQIVQADLFDSELEVAAELAKHGFKRAAGAVAGVVLERHLNQVCQNHSIAIAKKNPGISHFNDQLKNGNVIDIPQWRAIQHLGDLRNLCDHDKTLEPTTDQISDLISGVGKVTKTIF